MTTTQPPGTTVTIASPISGDFNDLVPLLTTFTPPRSCENSWVYSTEAKGTVWKDGDHNDDYGYSCLPFGGQNYKPGICPSGQEFKSVDRTVEDPGDEGSYAPTWWVGLCCSS
ncbi:hypothetical protein F4804DRAFT_277947 [Jackrogersella minutella]|nr:hypothetical protein F4804DRAFT_277947 [Jackrogersella minutella]